MDRMPDGQDERVPVLAAVALFVLTAALGWMDLIGCALRGLAVGVLSVAVLALWMFLIVSEMLGDAVSIAAGHPVPGSDLHRLGRVGWRGIWREHMRDAMSD